MTKNPFMSWWLSEWHKAANAAQGQIAAEMSRQQEAMMKAWTKQAADFWTAMLFPWAPRGGRRR